MYRSFRFIFDVNKWYFFKKIIRIKIQRFHYILFRHKKKYSVECSLSEVIVCTSTFGGYVDYISPYGILKVQMSALEDRARYSHLKWFSRLSRRGEARN